MSYIFTLTSTSHILNIDFVNPIQLDPEVQYGLALIGFHSYNSIPNIDSNCNTFNYRNIANRIGYIEIPEGAYEISDIEKYLRKRIIQDSIEDELAEGKILSIKPNHNTLKCEIYSETLAIDFSTPSSVGKLLGFSAKLLETGTLYESDLPVDIVKVKTLHIDCNITTGAFYKDRPTHTIYEFALDSNPGYAIDETPRHIIYLPVVNRNQISNISLQILDQNFEPVNFRGEEIIIRLELKKLT